MSVSEPRPLADAPADTIKLNVVCPPELGSDVWVAMNQDELCLSPDAGTVAWSGTYHLYIKQGYTAEAEGCNAEMTIVSTLGGYRVYSLQIPDEPAIPPEDPAVTITVTERIPLRSVNVAILCLNQVTCRIGEKEQTNEFEDLGILSFQDVELTKDETFQLGVKKDPVFSQYKVMTMASDESLAPSSADSTWTWYTVDAKTVIDQAAGMTLMIDVDTTHLTPTVPYPTLNITGDEGFADDGWLLKTFMDTKTLQDGQQVTAPGGYVVVDYNYRLERADDTAGNMFQYNGLNQTDDGKRVRVYTIAVPYRYDKAINTTNTLNLKAVKIEPDDIENTIVRLKVENDAGVYWVIGDYEGSGNLEERPAVLNYGYELDKDGTVIKTLRLHFEVEDEEEIGYRVEIETDKGKAERAGGELVLDPDVNTVTVKLTTPKVRIVNASEFDDLNDIILRNDPTGSFADGTLLTDGSPLPYGEGIFLLQNGYDIVLDEENGPFSGDRDWVHSMKDDGITGGDIYAYRYFRYTGSDSYSGYVNSSAFDDGYIDFKLVKTEAKARWTHVKVLPEDAAWEISDGDGSKYQSGTSNERDVYEYPLCDRNGVPTGEYCGIFFTPKDPPEAGYAVRTWQGQIEPNMFGDYYVTGDEDGRLTIEVIPDAKQIHVGVTGAEGLTWTLYASTQSDGSDKAVLLQHEGDWDDPLTLREDEGYLWFSPLGEPNEAIEVDVNVETTDITHPDTGIPVDRDDDVQITVKAPKLVIDDQQSALVTSDPNGFITKNSLRQLQNNSSIPYGAGVIVLKNGYSPVALDDDIKLSGPEWIYDTTGNIYSVWFMTSDPDQWKVHEGDVEINVTGSDRKARWLNVTINNAPQMDWALPDAPSESGRGANSSDGYSYSGRILDVPGADGSYTGTTLYLTCEYPECYTLTATAGTAEPTGPKKDEYTLTGGSDGSVTVTVSLTPKLVVESGDPLVLEETDPLDEGLSPLQNGDSIPGGKGVIIVPATYRVIFPYTDPGSGYDPGSGEVTGDNGMEYTQRFYFNEHTSGNIYILYEITSVPATWPAVKVTVSENPDPPHWTKVTAHHVNIGEPDWVLTDVAGTRYEYSGSESEVSFLRCMDDNAGMSLTLKNVPEPLVKVDKGTLSQPAGAHLLSGGKDGELDLTIYYIKVTYAGAGADQVIGRQEIVSSDGILTVTVPAGYTVGESTAYTVEGWSVYDSGKDGAQLTYVLNTEGAIKNGDTEVVVTVDAITPGTLTESGETGHLLGTDPYDGGYTPLLKDSDTVPADGGWLLVEPGYEVNTETSSGGLIEFTGYHSDGFDSTIYKLYRVYPTGKDSDMIVILKKDETPARWVKLTVNNPGGRQLSLSYDAPEYVSLDFSDRTLTRELVIESGYMILSGGRDLALSDITGDKGVSSVTADSGSTFRLALDTAAKEVVITVKAPPAAGSGTSPKTGDETAPGLWALLLAMSCAGLGAAGILSAKRRRSK